MGKKKSLPGNGKFRFTVDQLDGKYTTHSVTFRSELPPSRHESEEIVVAEDHDFVDEVVLGDWLHIEAMDRRTYWMEIAGIVIWVRFRKDGTVKDVTTYGPGEYADARDGVTYEEN